MVAGGGGTSQSSLALCMEMILGKFVGYLLQLPWNETVEELAGGRAGGRSPTSLDGYKSIIFLI